MNFGRTTQHRCWILPSSVKFWVTTYDAGENLERLLGFVFGKACVNLQTNEQAKKSSKSCKPAPVASLVKTQVVGVPWANPDLAPKPNFYAKQEQTPKQSTAQNYSNDG